MTSTLDTSPGPRQRARTRRFALQFGATMVLFAVVLVVSLVLGDWDGDSPWRFAWALAPVVPILATAAVLIRYVATSDEYEVLQTCRSLAVAFVVAMLLSIVLALLQNAGWTPDGAGWWIYTGGMLTWLIARIRFEVRR